MADSCCSSKGQEIERLARHGDQRRVLVAVLAINAVMFLLEFGAGVAAGSTALMADASDMLGDALVYALSIYALGRSAQWKAAAALAKGMLILLLGMGIVVNIIVKLQSGAPPSSALMLAFGGLAFAANLVCFRLLWRFRRHDVNMASTFECSRNDLISNIGVLVAAGAVAAFHSAWPDLLIGSVMALWFLRSAFRVLGQAGAEIVSA